MSGTMQNDKLLLKVKQWWTQRDGKPIWGALSAVDKQALIEQYWREHTKKK